jgi:hypothetical protein
LLVHRRNPCLATIPADRKPPEVPGIHVTRMVGANRYDREAYLKG